MPTLWSNTNTFPETIAQDTSDNLLSKADKKGGWIAGHVKPHANRVTEVLQSAVFHQ